MSNTKDNIPAFSQNNRCNKLQSMQ